MRISAACPHLGGHRDRLHQLLRRCAVPQRGLGVSVNAIGASRDMGHGDGDELLRLGGQGALGENLVTERSERRLDLGGELLALAKLGGDEG
jgi:hypothetical protein